LSHLSRTFPAPDGPRIAQTFPAGTEPQQSDRIDFSLTLKSIDDHFKSCIPIKMRIYNVTAQRRLVLVEAHVFLFLKYVAVTGAAGVTEFSLSAI